jgi:hypothetical protein
VTVALERFNGDIKIADSQNIDKITEIVNLI